MDFNFSDDQQQLRDAVAKWVEKGYDFERRRKIEAAGGFDRAAWNELAELGLAGLYIPEDDGGLGMGPVEGMVVLEELGRGIVLEPLAQSFIAGAVLAGHADAATKAAWLPRVEFPELDAVYRRLGLDVINGEVKIRQSAPAAAVRRAIFARPPGPSAGP